MAAEAPSADEEARDLFSVFVELAAVRNEARAQARIVKEALDQFRAVFETLQSSNAVLERELKEAHARAREPQSILLRADEVIE
jgi:molecular chaperone GrpE